MSDATTTNQDEADPLKAVADAMQAAADSLGQGAGQLSSMMESAGAKVMPSLSRAIYNSSYGLSYGVVFTTMVAVKLVPKDNPVVHGLVDGARAAIDLAREIRPDPSADEPTP